MNGQLPPVMDLVGVRYTRGGVSPATGFDCFTLMAYVRHHYFGRPTPVLGIPATPMPSPRAAAQAIFLTLGGKERVGSAWHNCEPIAGVAVAMGSWSFSRLHHCGVIVGNGVLHALEGAGVVWTDHNRLSDIYARVEYFECA